MRVPEIIYCANGNRERAEIAQKYKFRLGAQLPGTIYKGVHYDDDRPLHFADQNWEKPRYIRYIKALRKYRPYMASVLDIEEWRRLDEYLMRAEEISHYCQVVMLIPKVNGIIAELPRKINGKEIRLGYSVPTPFGGTTVPTEEFKGWPVHLLGSTCIKQKKLCGEMDVVSVDGNAHNGHANRGRFFVIEPFISAINKHWPTLREFYGDKYDGNGPLHAFELSCKNIMEFWQ